MKTANPFVVFMSGTAGRAVRIVAGIVLVLVAIYLVAPGVGRDILAVVGVVVFLAGAVNFCLFAPLFGAPFLGKDLR
jgi:hypothetical protein